jgi:aryl-alcohol dehydrogenase-like predicted oxidoreductase
MAINSASPSSSLTSSWAERDNFVVATKYTGGAVADGGVSVTGNSRKNMIHSAEASLRRLGTDRIDLYWVHFPDAVTPIDEIVLRLDDLSRKGKIIYAGFSDFLRGVSHGGDPCGGAWLDTRRRLADRVQPGRKNPERELLPMAAASGLWSPLGGGLLTGKYREGQKGRATDMKRVVRYEDTAQKTAVLDFRMSSSPHRKCARGLRAATWSSFDFPAATVA